MLKWEDIPTPQAGPGQVQVEVKATSLNHLDLWIREGIPGVPFPLVTGSDAAGIVSAVGKGVDTNRIGEKVMIQPLIYCNQCSVCQSGNENFCEGLGILGETQQGVREFRLGETLLFGEGPVEGSRPDETGQPAFTARTIERTEDSACR